MMDFVRCIVHFSELAEIEIGGSKGKTLSSSVQQIYGQFQHALQLFQQSVHYDLMDVDAPDFDDDFHSFRSTVEPLESRLACVPMQSFDDTATLAGKFQLLLRFGSLLERPLIAADMEPKHRELLLACHTELYEVNATYVQRAPQHRAHAPQFAARR